jgi:heptosyltransferase-2
VRRAVQFVSWILVEGIVAGAAALAPRRRSPPVEPQSVFVLRNNDVGDVLLATPLLAALRDRYPRARLTVGVGRWSVPVLTHNPDVDEILVVSAPWANNYAMPSSTMARWRYLLRSDEVDALREAAFEIGIDVTGTAWGSLLLMRAGIPWRLGVKGYSGGHSGTQAAIQFDPHEHVARSGLRFAELLGVHDPPVARPRIFLSVAERLAGSRLWSEQGRDQTVRIVVGPGGGLESKRWPLRQYESLLARLALEEGLEVAVVTGPKESGERMMTGGSRHLADLGLRDLFGLVAAAHLVVCNSSLLLHVAGAFEKPAVVLLGPAFASAALHQEQWGYPESVTLGPEPGRRAGMASTEEAAEVIADKVARIRAGAA